MKSFNNPIIPLDPIFYNLNSKKIVQWNKVNYDNLDFKAIAAFCALGYMLDDDTYSENIKVCKPSREYTINTQNQISSEREVWKWHYSPQDKSFKVILDEFIELFEGFVNKNTLNKSILLPISGGLDSRTLMAAVKDRQDVVLGSYEFEKGIKEIKYGRMVSKEFNLPFFSKKIPVGYLWNNLEKIGSVNNCFSDFLHPRQFVMSNDWKGLGDSLLLGHWGDVLFDSHSKLEKLSYDKQICLLKTKILKPSGIELAETLWNSWGLEGSFQAYINDRLDFLYKNINIDHPSARIRAFKSQYWAPRWTSSNLSYFKSMGEIALPYYSDNMCKYICNVPEYYLSNRKIQIEYIKKRSSQLAKISWQKFHPLNLYNYERFNKIYYYPIRASKKMIRMLEKYLYKTPNTISRNWENQFLGKRNDLKLNTFLLRENKFNKIVSPQISKDYIIKFNKNPLKYSHSISMLITLAVFFNSFSD